MDQIQRDGVWWTRDLVGGWLRFNAVTSEWESSVIPPPPPPPPPPGYVAPIVASEADPVAAGSDPAGDFPYDSSVYVPLPKKSRADHWRRLVARLDPRVAVAGAVVFALLLFGGVGWAVLGDNGTEPTSAVGASLAGDSGKLTPKQKFIRAADGLCADIMTATRKLPIPTDMVEAAAVMKKARTILARAIQQGQAIKTPKKARAGWNHFVDSDQLRVFDEAVAAIARGDIAAMERFDAEIKARGVRERRWAKRYGMKVCSQKL